MDSKEYPLYSRPLSQYLSDCAPALQFTVFASWNWRGHVASWVIEGQRLYLTEIVGDDQAKNPISVGSLFPYSRGPVPAIWVTETLQVPTQQRKSDVDLGYTYGALYQWEKLIAVESGKVKGIIEQEVLLV